MWMKTKLIFILASLAFSKCVASMPQVLTQYQLDEQFIEAAKNGATEVMTDLLNKGANVNTCGSWGFISRQTALHIAAKSGDLNTINLLIQAKINLDAQEASEEMTALQMAAYYNHVECVRALIQAKATVDALNSQGETALHKAASQGHVDCVKALLEAKASIELRDSNGFTALLKVDSSRDGHTACLKALIEAKADVHAKLKSGWTALHLAADSGNAKNVEILLGAKADVNARTSSGQTALHLVVMTTGNKETVKALLEAGIDVFARDNVKLTALCYTAHFNHSDCLKELVRYCFTHEVSAEIISEARKRILSVLLQFAQLRKNHLGLHNLKDATLQHEILSGHKLLQDDLAIILLDELKKGRALKTVFLIRSKDFAVEYLGKKLNDILAEMPEQRFAPDIEAILDRTKLSENLEPLIREGINLRVAKLNSENCE